MGKCSTTIREIRWITEDPEISHCYVNVTAEGDCPLGVQGWHHKAFPARIALVDVLTPKEFDFLMWAQEAPDR